MIWLQRILELPARPRGFHLITTHIVRALPELLGIRTVAGRVLQHTSASLVINENADPNVLADLEASLNVLAPEDFPYSHTVEGPDDMPAHVKAALLGCAVSIPVRNGELALGTWQGVYLGEHRNRASSRSLVLTLQGESERA